MLPTQMVSEPIRKVWIHDEEASRLSMMRIMARRMNAAAVLGLHPPAKKGTCPAPSTAPAQDPAADRSKLQ
jgi:hypothetical protein